MATRERGNPSSHPGGTDDAGKERRPTASQGRRKARQPASKGLPAGVVRNDTPGTAGAPAGSARRRRARKPTTGEGAHLPAAVVDMVPAVTADAEGFAPSGEASLPEAPPGPAAEPTEPTEVGGQAGIEEAPEQPVVTDAREGRAERHRSAHANALGLLIERQFADPGSPCHSYSDLERRSGISREALSRYVTSRMDRRRSPTIDTLVAIADALHMSLEGVARAAAAAVKGILPPPEDVQHVREEALGSLVAGLNDAQFNAVVELLRQLGPWRTSAT